MKTLIQVFKGAVPYYDHIFYKMAADAIAILASDWPDSAPSKNNSSVFVLKAETVTGQKVKIKFIGDFHKVGGEWRGKIDKIDFFQGSQKTGVLNTQGTLNLKDVYGETDSGFIWLKMAQDGFKGGLSGKDDGFSGSTGNDIINGRGGHDSLTGGPGDDTLKGGDGSDILNGGTGSDKLIGGRGNDSLTTSSGLDIAKGGAGNDVFNAAAQSGQKWWGGKGADKFQVTAVFASGTGSIVKDFNVKQKDKVDLSTLVEFQFNTYDEVRYIGKQAFSGDDNVFEIRMKNGFVSMDTNGDGNQDLGITLEGMGTLKGTSWIKLPDGFDFA